MEIETMETNFWDNEMNLVSVIKDIWQEPTPLKLEILRIKINEGIKKRTKGKTENAISTLEYSRERLRFIQNEDETPIRLFLYAFFPHKLIQTNNGHLELLKNPETWISSSGVNK
jgi:hypothetical protein